MPKQLIRQPGRRVIVAIILILIILSLGVGWFVSRYRIAPSNATARIAPTLPVPDAARSAFTSPQFGYTFQYPSQWTPVVSADKSRVQVFIVHDLSVPQGIGFDIICADNPSGLTAQQWRQSEVPPNSGETDAGYVTLSSGTQAYKVIGHADGTYDVFILERSGTICELTEYEQNNDNTKVIESSINSFTWN